MLKMQGRSPAATRWSLTYFRTWMAVVHKVYVCGGEISGLRPKIARQIERFEENLGHDYRRTKVDHDAPGKLAHYGCQPVKVVHRRLAYRSAVNLRVHMNNVRSQSNMYGQRNPELISRRKYAYA